MNEPVKIYTNEGTESVDGRELHAALGVGRDFSTWLQGRIDEYGFIEGEDFSPDLGKSIGGRPSIEYRISLDMAKELGMLENTPQGRAIRRYFIAAEKIARVKAREELQKEAEKLAIGLADRKLLPYFQGGDIPAPTDLMSIAEYMETRGLTVPEGYGQMLYIQNQWRRAVRVSREMDLFYKEPSRKPGQAIDAYRTLFNSRALEVVFTPYLEMLRAED